MREDRSHGRREPLAGGKERGDLINVTPFWVILMANVRHPEPTGGQVSEKHASTWPGEEALVHARSPWTFRWRQRRSGPAEELYILKTVITHYCPPN